MSGALNWEKVNRQKRLDYRPAQRARPASQRQLAYIEALAVEKGQRALRTPKTMKGASDLIERLLALPDVLPTEEVKIEPAPVKPSTQQELVVEIREHFPQLTPMTANSLVQVFNQVDELGLVFTLDRLMHEDTPETPRALIMHFLRRFLEEFSFVTDEDESALVTG